MVSALALRANITDVYCKQTSDVQLAGKASVADLASLTAQVSSALSHKVETSEFQTFAAVTESRIAQAVVNANQGPTGPAGVAGVAGAAGVAGVAGPTGAAGPVGPAGAAGVNGAVGPQGPQGPQGAIGPAGSQGATGPAGTIGVLAQYETDVLAKAGGIAKGGFYYTSAGIVKVRVMPDIPRWLGPFSVQTTVSSIAPLEGVFPSSGAFSGDFSRRPDHQLTDVWQSRHCEYRPAQILFGA